MTSIPAIGSDSRGGTAATARIVSAPSTATASSASAAAMASGSTEANIVAPALSSAAISTAAATVSGQPPPTSRSLPQLIQDEAGSLLVAHSICSLRAVLIRQGQPSPGLFIILRGEVLLQKELELVPNNATTSSVSGDAAAAGRPGTSGNTLPRRTVKPLQVALLGAGDWFGDLGWLESDVQRRSPLTILSNSAELGLLFLRRADLRTLSKPLQRALRAHSAARLEAHVRRVARLLAMLGPASSLPGELRSKTTPAELFWHTGGGGARGIVDWNAAQPLQQQDFSSTTPAISPSTPASIAAAVGSINVAAAAAAAPSSTTPRTSAVAAPSALATTGTVAAPSPGDSSSLALMTAGESFSRSARVRGEHRHEREGREELRRKRSLSSSPRRQLSPAKAAVLLQQQQQQQQQQLQAASEQAPRKKSSVQLAQQADDLSDSLARRYTLHKLRMSGLFFPPSLLTKIRAQVTQRATEQQQQQQGASAAAGGSTGAVRVSKMLGILLAATAPKPGRSDGANGGGQALHASAADDGASTPGEEGVGGAGDGGAAASLSGEALAALSQGLGFASFLGAGVGIDPSERATKESLKFFADALRTAENGRQGHGHGRTATGGAPALPPLMGMVSSPQNSAVGGGGGGTHQHRHHFSAPPAHVAALLRGDLTHVPPYFDAAANADALLAARRFGEFAANSNSVEDVFAAATAAGLARTSSSPTRGGGIGGDDEERKESAKTIPSHRYRSLPGGGYFNAPGGGHADGSSPRRRMHRRQHTANSAGGAMTVPAQHRPHTSPLQDFEGGAPSSSSSFRVRNGLSLDFLAGGGPMTAGSASASATLGSKTSRSAHAAAVSTASSQAAALMNQPLSPGVLVRSRQSSGAGGGGGGGGDEASANNAPNSAARLLGVVYKITESGLRGAANSGMGGIGNPADPPRFGKDRETLPSAPPKPSNWKPASASVAEAAAVVMGPAALEDASNNGEGGLLIGQLETLGGEGEGGSKPPLSEEDRAAAALAAQALRELRREVLTSPAPPRLHSALPGVRGTASSGALAHAEHGYGHGYSGSHHGGGATVLSFAEEYHTFSSSVGPTAMLPRKRLLGDRHRVGSGTESAPGSRPTSSRRGGRARKFLPSAKANTPLVLLAHMNAAVEASGDSPAPPETPQGILVRQALAREKAAAEREAASLAALPRDSLTAAEQYELDRAAALKDFSLSLEEETPFRTENDGEAQIFTSGNVSRERYQPQPTPPSGRLLSVSRQSGPAADDFLAHQYRVSATNSPRTRGLGLDSDSSSPVLVSFGRPSLTRPKTTPLSMFRRGRTATAATTAAGARAPGKIGGGSSTTFSSPRDGDARLLQLQRTGTFSQPEAEGEDAEEEEGEQSGLPPARARAFADSVREKLEQQYQQNPVKASAAGPLSPIAAQPVLRESSGSSLPVAAVTVGADESTSRTHAAFDDTIARSTGLVKVEPTTEPNSEQLALTQRVDVGVAAAREVDAAGSQSARVATIGHPRTPSAPLTSRSGASSARRSHVRRLSPPHVPEDARLTEPNVRLLRSQGAVRPRKAGSPPRRLARAHDSDDVMEALSPLTAAGPSAHAPRALLLVEVSTAATELQAELDAKAYARATAPPPRRTAMIAYSPAALRVTQKVKEPKPVQIVEEEKMSAVATVAVNVEDKGEVGAEEGAHLAARRHMGLPAAGTVVGANVLKLDIVASIPPPSPSPPPALIVRPSAPGIVGTAGTSLVSPRAKSASLALQSKGAVDALVAAELSAAVPTSGAMAAANGLLASSVAPLSAALERSGLGGLTTSLVAASQLLPSSSSARRLTELYAAFQRHLARSRDYFDAQAHSGRQGRANYLHKEDEAAASASAAADASSSLFSKTLHRVDSEGYIVGPDRTAPSLAPDAADLLTLPLPAAKDGLDGGPAAAQVHAASSLMARPGTSGGSSSSEFLGILEGLPPGEQAASLAVLADMLVRDDAIDNEQALRVLSSFDRQKGLVLPPVLVKRAKDLQDELHRRAKSKDEEAARAQAAVLAAASAVAKPSKQKKKKGKKLDGTRGANSSEEDEDNDDGAAASKRLSGASQPGTAGGALDPTDVLVVLRQMARRKAQAKFRLPRHAKPLFGAGSDVGDDASKAGATASAEEMKEGPQQSKEAKELAREQKALDQETARRVSRAVSAATERQQQSTEQSNSSPPVVSPRRAGSSTVASTSTVAVAAVRAPLPPSFMALYGAYGVAPSRDGSGLASKPLSQAVAQMQAKAAAAAATANSAGGAPQQSGKSAFSGLTLLDVVRQRANLERKLRQDDFLTKFASSALSPPTSPLNGKPSSPASKHNQLQQAQVAERPEVEAARRARMAELHALQLEEEAERQAALAAQSSLATARPTSASSSAYVVPSSSVSAIGGDSGLNIDVQLSARSSVVLPAYTRALTVGSNNNPSGGGAVLPSPIVASSSPRVNFSDYFTADDNDKDDNEANELDEEDADHAAAAAARNDDGLDVEAWLEQMAQARAQQAAAQAAAAALLPQQSAS